MDNKQKKKLNMKNSPIFSENSSKKTHLKLIKNKIKKNFSYDVFKLNLKQKKNTHTLKKIII